MHEQTSSQHIARLERQLRVSFVEIEELRRLVYATFRRCDTLEQENLGLRWIIKAQERQIRGESALQRRE